MDYIAGGGSNYLSYTPWADVENIVGWYHVRTDVARKQLQTFYANGQRKLAIHIWYTEISNSSSSVVADVWRHCIKCNGGRMTSQQRQNLKNVISLALSIGFTEIVLRWGAQGANQIYRLADWNETIFQECWGFIFDGIIASLELHQTVPILFDLGGDGLGGKADYPNCKRMTIELWRAYVNKVGALRRSYAFPMGGGGTGSITQHANNMLGWFQEAGLPMPGFYATNTYVNQYSTLSALQGILTARGEGGKKIIVEECYYDDPTTADQVRKAKDVPGLVLRSIYQWPATTDGNNVSPPVLWNAYKAL